MTIKKTCCEFMLPHAISSGHNYILFECEYCGQQYEHGEKPIQKGD